MTVCSNTTPFIALCSIGRLGLLSSLFDRVHVPRSVASECAAGGPISVPPLERYRPWVEIHDDPIADRPFLVDLGPGERAAIALALLLRSDCVVLDEALGRRVAAYHGLRVIGTLGLLAKAAQRGLIPSFRDAALAMRDQGIRYNPALIDRIEARLGKAQA